MIDPETGAIQRVIALQYNPDTLSRTLQPKSAGTESTDALSAKAERAGCRDIQTRSGNRRRRHARGAAIPASARSGFTRAWPCSRDWSRRRAPGSTSSIGWRAAARSNHAHDVAVDAVGVEQAPRHARAYHEDLAITEEAFDPNLNPIRAKVSLGLRVLSVDDLGFDTKGGNIFMACPPQQGTARGSLQGRGTQRARHHRDSVT